MNFSNMPIPRKLALAFATLIVTFLVVSGVIYSNVRTLNSVAHSRDVLGEVSDQADAMMNAVVEGQSAVRGYVLLGQDAFLKTYEENVQAIEDAAKAVMALHPTDTQRGHVEDFLKAAHEWEQGKVAKTFALYRDPTTREEARELAGVKQLSAMRKVMKSFKEDQDARSAEADVQQAAAERMVLVALIAGGLAAVALSTILAWLLTKAIAHPVRDMTATMSVLASGDTAVHVAGVERRDELGTMAKAVIVFRDAAAAKKIADAEQDQTIRDIGAGLSGLAGGDLTMRLKGLPPSFAKLQEDFNRMVDSLSAAFGAVSRGAFSINNGAADIRQASDDLSQRTEQQAASLEETAAAMDEITGMITRTATDAARANQAVAEAREEAEQGGQVVERAVEAMHSIERSSGEIAEIITLIDGIAFQTNLLALNAGVEAARAGDAGKGFAVVASEVRALAQRTAEAAKDVKERVLASAGQVSSGVELVGATGQALQRLIVRVGEIRGLVGDIAGAAEQQAEGLRQVNTAVGEMDGVTQQNAAMVEEANAAARSLSDEADELTRQVGKFRTAEPAPAAAVRGASPARELQGQVDQAIRRSAAPRRARGGAALAVAEDDWSEF